jgi:hypothetical protein
VIATSESPVPEACRPRQRWGDAPAIVAVSAVAWSLLHFRSEILGVAYLNDSAVHEQMVRAATALIRAGRLPLSAWYPYLGLGSPQFAHYQSLPAMLSGAFGLLVGPNVAFRWTRYVLLAMWPFTIYLLSRLMGLGSWSAACSAAMAPFVSSATHIGYEQGAYIWVGYGVWTQLWASITLPLSWGCTWQLIAKGRRYALAVGLVAFTTALHFETGYLAFLPLVVWPLVAGRPIVRHIWRSVAVIAGSLCALAWLVLPLLHDRA